MVRGLLRLLLIIVIVVALGAFFIGYRWATSEETSSVDRPVGTSGEAIDTSRARETGAQVGERVAAGANEAQEAINEAALTAKIKSKMALDDTIDANAIDVDTDGTIVTLSGRVQSEAARQRAVQLARETEGVTSVVDRLGR